MSFHKRWINLKNMLSIYERNRDIEDVCDYMCADALIVELGIADEIVKLINKGKKQEAIDILEKQLSKQ
jgi:hypothetical protein